VKTGALLFAGILILGLAAAQAASTLPTALDDAAFWGIITSFSEPDGRFRYDNLLSNETSYQTVIPTLTKIAGRGDAYIGVGPEQNFTYIAAIEPKIAFIVDIRRQNMLQQLMYKALFEVSPNRVEFVSRLFSRNRPPSVGAESSAAELFNAYELLPCDAVVLGQTLHDVNDRLRRVHQFPITDDDFKVMTRILRTFCMAGPNIDYGFSNGPPNLTAPSYKELMTTTDGRGQNRSYLATEENFSRVRDMQLRNLIVPLSGDFAGAKTLRSVAAYLKRNNAKLIAFYISNVEQYLDKSQSVQFRANLAALPATRSSAIIRFTPPESTDIEPVWSFLAKRGPLFRLLTD
jgi:hypothetical protein